MKKALLILSLLLLLFCACEKTETPDLIQQPVTLFYRTVQTDYSAEDGVIRAEIGDLKEKPVTDFNVFSLYFEGPRSKDLILPFSSDILLTDVFRSGNDTLVLKLTRKSSTTESFEHTLAYACLAKTGFALEGVQYVNIQVKTSGSPVVDERWFSKDEILLYDTGTPSDNVEITLYFSDESGRLLLPEKRSIEPISDELMPSYVLGLLLDGPQSAGFKSALPPGSRVMEDVSVRNGVCTVDFYPDFFVNAPESEQGQTLAILSVVNTLCELNTVSQVQIYKSGLQVQPGSDTGYPYLDLSDPWTSDSSVVGPIREELGEFLGELCLPGQRSNGLHRLIVRARARGGASKEEALLQALFSRTAKNGYDTPFAHQPVLLSVSTEDRLCTLELQAASLPEEEMERGQAIRCITATLASLPEVDAVLIYENGVPLSREPLKPDESWFQRS